MYYAAVVHNRKILFLTSVKAEACCREEDKFVAENGT
jgi:hypothetical protein